MACASMNNGLGLAIRPFCQEMNELLINTEDATDGMRLEA
jgi:hypothetical protein